MLLVSACLLAGSAGWTQQSQKPVQTEKVSTDLAVMFAAERSQAVPSQCCFWFKGGGADVAVTFWKGLGIAASVTGDHASDVSEGSDLNKISFLAGPRYTWTAWNGQASAADLRRLQIFVQGLFGGAHGFNGAYPSSTGTKTSASSLAIQAGGGFDFYLTQSFGIRLLEADYVRTEMPNGADGVQNDFRLAAGITYHFGSFAPPAPVTVACSAGPAVVFPGDPVTVTATANDVAPKMNVIYSLSGAGMTASTPTATVATAALAPGSYTVKCEVKEGKPGKEGLKPWEVAEASASFTVKAFEPPTVSCSASPSTIKPGDMATVTALGVSPQNRPLTYSFSATSGAVSGSGATASFSSVGAPTGPVVITCNVTDDKGQTATANTSVTITAPYVPPAVHTQALCSISFTKDTKRPTRVDNEAKACLDEVALDLQKQPDAKSVVVGASDAKEKAKLAKDEKAAEKHKHLKVVDPAAERAVNTKEYLVTEKGIDASRISVATGTADDKNVEDYLVPAGATFTADVTGTTAVDEATVKAQPRKALATRKHLATKKAAK
jgi:hypothetical protein